MGQCIGHVDGTGTLRNTTAPVLCHGPALWFPSSGSGGDSPTLALLHLISPSSLAAISMFLQSCLQSPSGLPNVDLAAAAGDTIYHIGLLTKR